MRRWQKTSPLQHDKEFAHNTCIPEHFEVEQVNSDVRWSARCHRKHLQSHTWLPVENDIYYITSSLSVILKHISVWTVSFTYPRSSCGISYGLCITCVNVTVCSVQPVGLSLALAARARLTAKLRWPPLSSVSLQTPHSQTAVFTTWRTVACCHFLRAHPRRHGLNGWGQHVGNCIWRQLNNNPLVIVGQGYHSLTTIRLFPKVKMYVKLTNNESLLFSSLFLCLSMTYSGSDFWVSHWFFNAAVSITHCGVITPLRAFESDLVPFCIWP